jgi:CubicO group peptidase (beta-lactamase class C family)
MTISSPTMTQERDRSSISDIALKRTEDVGFSSPRLGSLAGALQRMVDERWFAGISTAVTRHHALVFQRTFGVQDVATREPLRADAIFRIASMTKPVTGVAMMLLYEEGRWQLDDPVEKFLPEFAHLRVLDPSGRLVPQIHPMTMRELLTNTGGISGAAGVAGQFANGPGNEVRRMYLEANLAAGTLADMVTKIAGLPLATQPGTRFQYGLSQDVQGRIIEVLSGQTLEGFFRSRIFEPLGMRDSGFAVPPSETARLVPLVTYGAERTLIPASFAPSSYMSVIFGDPSARPRFLSGGGGLYSTVADYVRFAEMLAGRGRLGEVQLLAPSSVGLMTSDMLPPGVPAEFRQQWAGCGYGIGVGIVLDPARATLMGGPIGRGTFHWSGAHGTWFWVDPTNDLTVVGMVQQEFAGIVHVGAEHPAPDLRALSRSLVYQALTDPER